jgi:hypothetical protein
VAVYNDYPHLEKGMMRSRSGQVYIILGSYVLMMIIMIRKVKMRVKDTAKRCVKQVSLSHFIVPDPQDRRKAHAPMCLR